MEALNLAAAAFSPLANHATVLLCCCAMVLYSSMVTIINADIVADREALLDFIAGAGAARPLAANWTGTNPCSWDGVVCYKGRVWHLILEDKGLNGMVLPNTLARLDQLRHLSLKNNLLSGPMPDLSNSPTLRDLWLSNNLFSGSIPDIFSNTPRFNKLDLSHNKLQGLIPPSLALLAKLETLYLQDNELSGPIPNLNTNSLTSFNVSNNHLNGPIPSALSNQSPSLLSNNGGLCGPPLSTSCPPIDPSKHHHHRGMSKVLMVLLIVIGDIILLSAVSFVVVKCYKARNKKKKVQATTSEQSKRDGSSEDYANVEMTSIELDPTAKTYDKASKNVEMTEAEKSKLVVFRRPGRLVFDLQGLLKASAELLGKGNMGTAYKAMLVHGGSNEFTPISSSALVVKRLRDMHTISKKEFDQQMLTLGQLQHPNLVPLLAYYFAKDEKFLVYEYIPFGSLYSLLHGNHGLGQASLDWDSRLKIARGIARGMAYLHSQLKWQTIPHGNLKSTNVLIAENMVPKIVDFGMVPLLTTSGAHSMASFKSPEYSATKTITAQADVYSYGLILLEILSGKWMKESIVSDYSISQVFDEEVIALGENPNNEKSLMLHLARQCLSTSPEERPTMQKVIKIVEGIKTIESPTTAFVLSSPESFVTDYETPRHSLQSERSSFEGFMSSNKGDEVDYVNR